MVAFTPATVGIDDDKQNNNNNKIDILKESEGICFGCRWYAGICVVVVDEANDDDFLAISKFMPLYLSPFNVVSEPNNRVSWTSLLVKNICGEISCSKL
jgi:hypothetical protein